MNEAQCLVFRGAQTEIGREEGWIVKWIVEEKKHTQAECWHWHCDFTQVLYARMANPLSGGWFCVGGEKWYALAENE